MESLSGTPLVPFGEDLLAQLDPGAETAPESCVTGLTTPENGVDPGSGTQDDWPQRLEVSYDAPGNPASLN